jgi:hypothetical protein
MRNALRIVCRFNFAKDLVYYGAEISAGTMPSRKNFALQFVDMHVSVPNQRFLSRRPWPHGAKLAAGQLHIFARSARFCSLER